MKVGRGSSERKAAENLYFFWQEINIEKRKKGARNIAPWLLIEHFNYVSFYKSELWSLAAEF